MSRIFMVPDIKEIAPKEFMPNFEMMVRFDGVLEAPTELESECANETFL